MSRQSKRPLQEAQRMNRRTPKFVDHIVPLLEDGALRPPDMTQLSIT